jgi:hypothetical protein
VTSTITCAGRAVTTPTRRLRLQHRRDRRRLLRNARLDAVLIGERIPERRSRRTVFGPYGCPKSTTGALVHMASPVADGRATGTCGGWTGHPRSVRALTDIEPTSPIYSVC